MNEVFKTHTRVITHFLKKLQNFLKTTYSYVQLFFVFLFLFPKKKRHECTCFLPEKPDTPMHAHIRQNNKQVEYKVLVQEYQNVNTQLIQLWPEGQAKYFEKVKPPTITEKERTTNPRPILTRNSEFIFGLNKRSLLSFGK